MAMKKYLIILGMSLVAFAACENYNADKHKFDNSAYLDVSAYSDIQWVTFNNNQPAYDRSLKVTLAYPEPVDVKAALAVDPSLVAAYNARYGTQCTILDSRFYELSTSEVTIPAGKNASESVTLHLKGLMGEGDAQTGALPVDETYLVPIRISSASVDVMRGADVAYYVVKRSSAITVAAQLTDNWIEFPTLDKWSEHSAPWNGLTAVTYEALICIDEFVEQNKLGNTVNISSVMGVEQYLLLRIGDVNFERRQLQFDGSGGGSAFGKIPERDASKTLEAGRWYHVACTYDQSTRTVRIYVDGKIQSEVTDAGVVLSEEKNRINLAMRALYDRWASAPEAEKPLYGAEGLQYDGLGDAYQFFIGRSYDDCRPLNGKIAEVRVWSVARTPEQIWENMYGLRNPADDPALLGYWKFNDAAGNTVKDYSRYRNDGVAKYDLIWPSGIEIPKINETKE